MKNNKQLSGSTKSLSGSSSQPSNGSQNVSGAHGRPLTSRSGSTVSGDARRVAASEKTVTSTSGGNQENLTTACSNPSVSQKRLVTTKHPSHAIGGLKSKGDANPIRPVNRENIPVGRNGSSVARKTNSKLSSVNNMRRAASKDSLDSNGTKEREKENIVKSGGKNHGKNTGTTATVLQLEKENIMLKQQVSELVRNAESKKAEIATLKMEMNRLKENEKSGDDDVEQLQQELERLRSENLALREHLQELGASVEQAALSDNDKEQLLLRRATSGSMGSLDSERRLGAQSSPLPGPSLTSNKLEESSPPEQEGEASGMGLPLSEWDKASSSSMSEMSVACLQDRILQMEETHYSTNEELQATLQELTDLQDQLTDLRLDNETIINDKAVLLESLCSQTEKLEEARSQIAQLKQLLFQQYEEGIEPTYVPTERELHLVELLKNAHEEHESLLVKQEELSMEMQTAKNEAIEMQEKTHSYQDRIKLLESTVDSVNSDKRLLEQQLSEIQEHLSAKNIEISQLKLQLDNEQQKVQHLQREREASATSELDTLLREARHDKELVEAHAVHLQEQLALSQHEANRLKEQLTQLQEENMVAKNNARKQMSDMEYRLEQLEKEKLTLQKEMEILEDALHEAELKCQRHLEDKRELKATVVDLQKSLNEASMQLKEAQKEQDEFKKKHENETQEWEKFQADLLMTVRVANDFKTEAQHDVDRLMNENKQLQEKIEALEEELEKLKAKQDDNFNIKPDLSSPLQSRSMVLRPNSEGSVLSNVERELATPRRPLTDSKWRDHRGATQLSVRSLIESIENATKTKGQVPSSSRSSSNSSLNSVTSDTRQGSLALSFANGGDIFIKTPLRTSTSETSCLLRDGKTGNRIQRTMFSDGTKSAICNESGITPSSTKLGGETEPSKPIISPHPVSILANKLEPIRRNSSYGDMVEKKDPLAALIRGGGSKRNALLKWCQNKTMGYKGIDITNFSSSWNDGLAFCALLHTYLPDAIPYDELDSKNKRRNFTIAFQAAESVGIPTTLNINDLISQERPDWQSIMSYVTSLYKHFET